MSVFATDGFTLTLQKCLDTNRSEPVGKASSYLRLDINPERSGYYYFPSRR
jgi:hypothetical protein